MIYCCRCCLNHLETPIVVFKNVILPKVLRKTLKYIADHSMLLVLLGVLTSPDAFSPTFPSHPMSLCIRFCFPGVEKPEAEKGRELPEDYVLPGASLPDLHEAEDAEHGSGHSGEPERPAAGPVQVPQRNERPAWLSYIQICHVLPQKLKP